MNAQDGHFYEEGLASARSPFPGRCQLSISPGTAESSEEALPSKRGLGGTLPSPSTVSPLSLAQPLPDECCRQVCQNSFHLALQ